MRQEEYLKIGNVEISFMTRQVKVDGTEKRFTLKEFDLLALLALNRGKVFSRSELLKLVWGYNFPGNTRTVDVHIKRIRDKLEKDAKNPDLIITIYGMGYKIN